MKCSNWLRVLALLVTALTAVLLFSAVYWGSAFSILDALRSRTPFTEWRKREGGAHWMPAQIVDSTGAISYFDVPTNVIVVIDASVSGGFEEHFGQNEVVLLAGSKREVRLAGDRDVLVYVSEPGGVVRIAIPPGTVARLSDERSEVMKCGTAVWLQRNSVLHTDGWLGR